MAAGLQEAEDRKARSIARLQADGVPTIAHLPRIEEIEEARPRAAEEVARRAVALAVVAVFGETNDRDLIKKVIEQLSPGNDFTPKERAFLANSNPTDQERARFSWRYEALNVLLWAIGFIPHLDRPDHIVDVPESVGIIRDEGRDGLIAAARLRPLSQLLDEADLIYRMHWAVTDARINGRPAPAGLDGAVVFERHYALNWLIGYMDQDWDDVTTDT